MITIKNDKRKIISIVLTLALGSIFFSSSTAKAIFLKPLDPGFKDVKLYNFYKGAHLVAVIFESNEKPQSGAFYFGFTPKTATIKQASTSNTYAAHAVLEDGRLYEFVLTMGDGSIKRIVEFEVPLDEGDIKTTLDGLRALRNAMTHYYISTEGEYPSRLEELVPRYISRIPTCYTNRHGAQNGVTPYSRRPQSPSQVRETGKWGYVGDRLSIDWGAVFVSSTENDLYQK